MKRSRAIRIIGLGGWLIAGSFATRGEAGPYVTYRTKEPAAGDRRNSLPARSFMPLENFASRPGRSNPLDVDFEPGIGAMIHAPLPPPSAANSEGTIASHATGHMPLELMNAPPPLPPRRTVPEPASIVLVVTGLIGLAARRRLLRNRL